MGNHGKKRGAHAVQFHRVFQALLHLLQSLLQFGSAIGNPAFQFFIQQGVLNRHRNLRGEELQRLDILLGEDVALRAVFDVQHPQHVPFGEQRNTNHRAQLQIHHAVGIAEFRVAQGIVHHQRGFLLDHVLQNGVADLPVGGGDVVSILIQANLEGQRAVLVQPDQIAEFGLHQVDGDLHRVAQQRLQGTGSGKILPDFQQFLQGFHIHIGSVLQFRREGNQP